MLGSNNSLGPGCKRDQRDGPARYSGTSSGRLLYSENSSVVARHSSSKPKCFVTTIVAMKTAVVPVAPHSYAIPGDL